MLFGTGNLQWQGFCVGADGRLAGGIGHCLWIFARNPVLDGGHLHRPSNRKTQATKTPKACDDDEPTATTAAQWAAKAIGV